MISSWEITYLSAGMLFFFFSNFGGGCYSEYSYCHCDPVTTRNRSGNLHHLHRMNQHKQMQVTFKFLIKSRTPNICSPQNGWNIATGAYTITIHSFLTFLHGKYVLYNSGSYRQASLGKFFVWVTQACETRFWKWLFISSSFITKYR